MEKVELKKENVLKAYAEGCSDVKKVLKNLLGEELFVPAKQDWLQLFKQFCKDNGLSYVDIVGYEIKNKKHEAAIAYNMLVEIIEVANKKDNGGREWFPDWDNSSEYKYQPWFDMRSGSGFAFYNAYDWHSGAGAGSRLCFKNESTAKTVAIKYLAIYEKFMTK